MIIPDYYNEIRFVRSGRMMNYDYDRRRDLTHAAVRIPEILFRVVYWMQPKPSTEEGAGSFMTGFCDEKPLGNRVHVVRGWQCAACRTCIFTAGWDGLDHPCEGLGDVL